MLSSEVRLCRCFFTIELGGGGFSSARHLLMRAKGFLRPPLCDLKKERRKKTKPQGQAVSWKTKWLSTSRENCMWSLSNWSMTNIGKQIIPLHLLPFYVLSFIIVFMHGLKFLRNNLFIQFCGEGGSLFGWMFFSEVELNWMNRGEKAMKSLRFIKFAFIGEWYDIS